MSCIFSKNDTRDHMLQLRSADAGLAAADGHRLNGLMGDRVRWETEELWNRQEFQGKERDPG